MSKTITLRDAVRLAKKHAASAPNKQASCQYVRDGEPECIVGRILISDLGVDKEFLATFGDRFQVLAPRLRDKGLTFTDEAVQFLENVQSIQDNRPNAVRTAAGRLVSLPRDTHRHWRNAVNVALDIAGSRAARV
jgi:hypothetical protein